MTLAQWSKKYGIRVGDHKGAKWTPAEYGKQSHRDLFHLKDYVVSSVTGGSVWLVKRRTKKNPPLTMFDVYKGRKLIDTIPYSGKMTSEEMKRSLVNHDGYDPSIRVRKRRSKRNCSRRTKRNSPMRVKKSKLGTIAIAGAAVAAVWYFFLRKKGLSDPLPIVALRDPSREPGSTGMSYPAREQNRANAVEAAKYLKPGISDAKAKEIADAMMRSGLMRSYAQRVLSVSEWTNLQPFRNVVENLTR